MKGAVQPLWLAATTIVEFSAGALFLNWFVLPRIAGQLADFVSSTPKQATPTFLVVDIVLSAVVFLAACSFAACIVRGRPYMAAVGVAAISSLVSFVAGGSVAGIVASSHPIWYELFPTHIGPGLLVAYLARNRQG